ncbi:MAG: protein kinase [Candidatus Manganitrophus sp.]|nr:MAG: protein kinase [Candidatus Manganitrophus sp.]
MEKLLGEKQPRKAAALFGKYRLLRPLKRSPFLENYLAQEESPPHTTVVLKRLHPLVIHRTDWVSLFLDEAKQAATLWHPNILRIYDLGVIDGVPYFVQPYLFGKKLQTLLARSRSLPIPTGMALLLIRQLLEALQFSHGLRGRSGRPIAHGGLHPERIFIGYDGVVGIGDFGLGWLEDPRSAIRSRYRAPESISEKKGGEIPGGTPGEDLFAASAILCELLGEFPEPVKADMEPWGYLPASIRSILVRGLAIDPAARFQTAGEMIAPIESILQGEYPRLNLTNYIQAFFGKEIEAERRAFMRFAPTEGRGLPFRRAVFLRAAGASDPLGPAAGSGDLSGAPSRTGATRRLGRCGDGCLPPRHLGSARRGNGRSPPGGRSGEKSFLAADLVGSLRIADDRFCGGSLFFALPLFTRSDRFGSGGAVSRHRDAARSDRFPRFCGGREHRSQRERASSRGRNRAPSLYRSAAGFTRAFGSGAGCGRRSDQDPSSRRKTGAKSDQKDDCFIGFQKRSFFNSDVASASFSPRCVSGRGKDLPEIEGRIASATESRGDSCRGEEQ